MKIHELYVEGFGPFSETAVGPFNSPITVIYGPNEAGKSSLLAFIRTVLFGFPTRGFATYYPPQSGGRHGGRVTISDGNGRPVVVERFEGGKGGLLAVTGEDGAPLPDSTLAAIIGHAPPDLFSRVFAFSLDELQTGEFLKDQSVNGHIYSAGMGASALPDSIKAIRSRKETLFLKRGRTKEVDKVLAELRENESHLEEVEGNAARYGELLTRQSEVKKEIEGLSGERVRLQRGIDDQERLKQGWDAWVELTQIEEALNELPLFDSFPVDPIPSLERSMERVSSLKVEIGEAEQALEAATAATDATVGNQDIVGDRDAIERVRRGRSSLDKSVEDLPERRAELRQLEDALGERLRDLAHDWDEGHLKDFDTSTAVRDEIAQAQSVRSSMEQQVRERRFQLEGARSDLDEAVEEELEARRRMDEFDDPGINSAELDERNRQLRTARGKLDEYARAEDRLDDLRAQYDADSGPIGRPRSRMVQATFIGIVGIVAIVVGVWRGGESTWLGLAVGATLVAWVVYTLLQSSVSGVSVGSSSIEERLRLARETKGGAHSELKKAASALGLDLPDQDMLQAKETELDSLASDLQAFTVLQESHADAKRSVEGRRRRLAAAEKAGEAARRELEAAVVEWRRWLKGRGLAESLTPQTMAEFLGRVDAGRALLEQVASMRRRVEAVEDDIEEHRRTIVPLAEKHGVSVGSGEGRGLAHAADELITLLDEASKQLQVREQARRELLNAQGRVDRLRKRLEEEESSLAGLLKAGGAGDEDEFRRNSDQVMKREELERERRERVTLLQRFSGPGDALKKFRRRLGETAAQEIEERLVELDSDLRSAGDRLGDLQREQGEIGNELSRLEGEEESSRLRNEKNVLSERLSDHATEWSKLALAEWLLERTRAKFERERQPSVIQHAEEFFRKVTNDRYQKVYSPVGEQTVTVVDETGATKQPDQLSRGTQEQLYLAVRFGLIREFGEHSERLPVVVDEILVNFDHDRARRAADAFAELSVTNQVLVFTCHPETVALFQSAHVATQVVNLEPFAPQPYLFQLS